MKKIDLNSYDFKVITNLYDKIKLDNRHGNAIMVSYGPIKEKSFPTWSMGSRKISGSEVDFKTDISNEEKKIFNNLLSGREESGIKVLEILKKFF